MFTEDSLEALMRLFLFAVGVLLVAGCAFAQGKQFLTTKEALELAFPKCEVERSTHALDAAEQARIEKLCGEKPRRAMVYAYRATRDGEVVGTAWFDRHRVRSKQELLMVVVGADGKLARIEVIAFEEPLDYLPRDGFYEQLLGKGLSEELSTKRAIRPVAGATLTVNATMAAVRRILATHAVLYPKDVAADDGETEEQPKPAEQSDEREAEERAEQSGDSKPPAKRGGVAAMARP